MPDQSTPTPAGDDRPRRRWIPVTAVVVLAGAALYAGATLGSSTRHTPPEPLPDQAAESESVEADPVDPDPEPNEDRIRVVESGWAMSQSGEAIHWGAIVENTSAATLAGAVLSFGKLDTDREDRIEIPSLLPGERAAVGQISRGDALVAGSDREFTVIKTRWLDSTRTDRPQEVTVGDITTGWVDPDADDAFWTSGELADSPTDADRSVVRYRADSPNPEVVHCDATAVFRDADGRLIGAGAGEDIGREIGAVIPPGDSTHAMIIDLPNTVDPTGTEVHLRCSSR